MKRLLIYILLLANLCSGLAFAWDTHPEAMVGSDVAAINLAASVDHGDPADDLHHHDHSCHSPAHLVGVFYDATMPVVPTVQDHHTLSHFVLPTLYITPLLRPPIV